MRKCEILSHLTKKFEEEQTLYLKSFFEGGNTSSQYNLIK